MNYFRVKEGVLNLINRTKRNLKNKKGFTLIELVVVIAVIGILAAIAIPRVTGITSKAKTEAKKQHIAVMNSAVERYKAENGIDDIVTAASTSPTKVEKVLTNSAAVLQELKDKDYLSDDVSLKLPSDGTASFDYDKDMFQQ